ncbi:unknown protein [Microcystis aeruginosa NIES-843]|uniref:Uncharacterized protein n=1 Tax=Microcystis aeruginosa (strain NIES-843 / IAM M-2473) TaxID=449447 RepID=B0JHK4_MICAN|nr:unknown protein [Microcystis aeruginosa NIES-843]
MSFLSSCLLVSPAKGKSLIFAAELISDGDNLSPRCIQVNREKVKTQEIMT